MKKQKIGGSLGSHGVDSIYDSVGEPQNAVARAIN